MAARGGGSVADADVSSAAIACFPNYNVMGVAKAALESSVRYLAADLGRENIRVNAISAGPVKTLAAAGIGGFSTISAWYREKAPLRRNNRDLRSRRCGARSCSAMRAEAMTGEVLMVDAGFHILGM